jgi:hypothetical protein
MMTLYRVHSTESLPRITPVKKKNHKLLRGKVLLFVFGTCYCQELKS